MRGRRQKTENRCELFESPSRFMNAIGGNNELYSNLKQQKACVALLNGTTLTVAKVN